MIKFTKIAYKNFLGTGDQPTEIQLDRDRTTLITGTNGSGKSTILDAICFALFGKAYRNINKPQLVNSVNGKKCEVYIEFIKGETRYEIIRGIGPAKFEILIDGQQMSQDADVRTFQTKLETTILGMDFTAFTQIVILGSARYQSFMDIESSKRKEVVEGLLDIGIFSKMNDVLKDRTKAALASLQELDVAKTISENSIKSQERLIALAEQKASELKVDAKAEIDKQMRMIDELDGKIDDATKLYESVVEPQVEDPNEIRAKINDVDKRRHAVLAEKARLEQQITFYEDNKTCNECGQDIDEAFAQRIITSSKDKCEKHAKVTAAASEAIMALREKLKIASDTLDAYDATLAKRNRDLDFLRGQRDAAKAYLKTLMAKQDQSAAPDNEIEGLRQELQVHQEKLKHTKEQWDEHKRHAHHLTIAKALLKDTGIKAKIVSQYLPVMNTLIAQYLDQMGADYSFQLDANFDETIKSRYRDKFSYASFSEGQKARIDLALMLTWREIAKLKNSVNTNLLILDEVGDSSLDAAGAQVLWEILSSMEGSNTFVISHRANNTEMFDRLLTFKQVGNFSKLAE